MRSTSSPRVSWPRLVALLAATLCLVAEAGAAASASATRSATAVAASAAAVEALIRAGKATAALAVLDHCLPPDPRDHYLRALAHLPSLLIGTPPGDPAAAQALAWTKANEDAALAALGKVIQAASATTPTATGSATGMPSDALLADVYAAAAEIHLRRFLVALPPPGAPAPSGPQTRLPPWFAPYQAFTTMIKTCTSLSHSHARGRALVPIANRNLPKLPPAPGSTPQPGGRPKTPSPSNPIQGNP